MGLQLPVMCLLMFLSGADASRDNTGTEFIVGFMWNTVNYQVGLEIFVTTMSNTPADVKVTTPLYDSGFLATATVQRMQVELLIIPYPIRVEGVGKSNKGVRILSTQPITVYCVNKEHFTTDAYMALPVHVVGKEYYSVHYIRSPQILLVGIEDGTSFSVRMSDNSRAGSATSVSSVSFSWNGNNYGNGDTLSSSINRYETFFITQYDDYSADFTGSYITSNKPVSAISGNYRCNILSSPPDGSKRSSDHLTEMLPPVDSWGKEYVSTSTPDRTIGDIYRIVGSEDNTYVNMGNGVRTFTLQRAGDYYEYDVKTGSHLTIIADKPVMVAMFAKTHQGDGAHYGDPAMSLISPTNQYAAEYTWSTTNLPSGDPFNNKVTVIIDKNKKSGLLLDGSAISSSWESVTGSSKYQQTWVFVNPGSHNIYHVEPTATFFALATGTEKFNSYAFAAGTRMAQINAPCSPTSPVAGDTVDNDCDGLVDEEALDNIDNDGDGSIDEDLALPPRVDGNWGNWGSWSCSITCGGTGTNTRTRACDDPAPQNNGEDCPGTGTQTGSCNMNSVPCPVDGGLTNWSGWSSCSVTCGSGTQGSTRSCTSPTPQHGGANCVGDTSRSKSCNTGVSCAVDGGWGTWASWSSCSVTCNTGSQERTRSCDRPAPFGGGAYCPGSGTDTKSCTMIPCPIDGGWGTWVSWSACSVTCATGSQTRSRTCDRPTPQHSGAACPGSDADTQSCTMIPCPIDGYWGTWAAWSSCSVTCELGTQTRSRACDRPAPQHSGADCTGTNGDTQSCTMIPCPIDGGWGTWVSWSACSVTCATGSQTRSRTCDRPTPQHSGAACPGSDADTQSCTMIPCPIDGYWGTWAAWSSCSVTCELGTQTRSRACDRPAPQHNGADCTGTNGDTQSCTMIPCPIDGGWGTWVPWSTCSVTCELGSQQRSRTCDRPTPQHNGANCPGSTGDTQSCTMIPCPIDGGWGTWGSWSDCSVSCGGVGLLERTRTCDRPPPQHNGAPCPGTDTDNTPCDVSHLLCPSGNVWEILTYTTAAPTPVDGGFGPWSGWTQCTVPCGGGIRFQQRFCNDPKPQGSGQPCVGVYVNEEMCNTQSCAPNSYAHGVAHGGVCNGVRGQFDCENGIQCIDILNKCNCKADCSDGSDETMAYAGCITDIEECSNKAETRLPMSFVLTVCACLMALVLQQFN